MATEKNEELSAPSSQGKAQKDRVWFEFFNQRPRLTFPEDPDKTYQLMPLKIEIQDDKAVVVEVDKNNKKKSFQVASTPEAVNRLKQDLDTLETELMPLFRVRDHAAKRDQNRYRRYQISFIFLATMATAVGSFQVWALQTAPEFIVWLGLLETAIALFTTFIATLIGTRQPLGEWLENRRLAEQLRREFFRYLMDIEPYDKLERPAREKHLAQRAAAINNRTDPDSIIDPKELLKQAEALRENLND